MLGSRSAIVDKPRASLCLLDRSLLSSSADSIVRQATYALAKFCRG